MTFQAFCGRITDAQRQAEQRGCLRRCRKRDWKHRLGAWGPRGGAWHARPGDWGLVLRALGSECGAGAALGPGEPRLQVLVQWGLSFPHRCYQGAGPGMSHHLPSALYQLCDHRKGPAYLGISSSAKPIERPGGGSPGPFQPGILRLWPRLLRLSGRHRGHTALPPPTP